ncbi:hypothetical protein D2T31_18515 [Sinirhodobacter populi]|uniref:Hydantoinase B/oxoprolinase domain-containing protein n=1 Tax=Paenirhodobacter populi TaxID=2306993 RepID=A0A443K2H9_9RHOB|nr:hypothetical protein D2T31_18515 [Sinirhodobacter populi]
MSNCSNTLVEANDRDFPFFRLIGAGLRADTGGAGQFRGGLGFFKSYEILEDDTKLAFYSDRFHLAPEGLHGGAVGGTGGLTLRRDGSETALASRGTWELKRCDVVTVLLGGGAGYGPADARDPAALVRDLEDGLVTA